MKISGIKKLKSGKYKVQIDDEEITTYDDVIIKNSLLYKKEIDDDVYNKLYQDTAYYDIYNKTVKLIMKKMRSEKEIHDYLNKFELNDKEHNKIIEHLKCIGLINDKEFVRSYISDRIYLSNDGPLKIRAYLEDNNIDISLIDNEMNRIDREEINRRLNKLVAKKVKTNHNNSEYKLREKIKYELVNLGYDSEDVIDALNNYTVDDSGILLKEYNKIYNKWSKKYSGKELENKVREKLFVKGFSMNDIEHIINESI